MEIKKILKHFLFLFLILLTLGIIWATINNILKDIFFGPVFSTNYWESVSFTAWTNSILAIIVLSIVPLIYSKYIKLTKKEWATVVIFLMVLTNLFTIFVHTLPISFHEQTNNIFGRPINAFPPAQYANTVCFTHQAKIINGKESECFLMDEESNYFISILHNILFYAIFLGFLILGSLLNKKNKPKFTPNFF